MKKVLGGVLEYSIKNQVSLYDAMEEMYNNEFKKDYYLIDKEDDGLVLVSKAIEKDHSREVIALINSTIIKAGKVPSFVNLSKSIKDKFTDYFNNDLYGLSIEEMEKNPVLSNHNIELYAELAIGIEVLQTGVSINPYNITSF